MTDMLAIAFAPPAAPPPGGAAGGSGGGAAAPAAPTVTADSATGNAAGASTTGSAIGSPTGLQMAAGTRSEAASLLVTKANAFAASLKAAIDKTSAAGDATPAGMTPGPAVTTATTANAATATAAAAAAAAAAADSDGASATAVTPQASGQAGPWRTAAADSAASAAKPGAAALQTAIDSEAESGGQTNAATQPRRAAATMPDAGGKPAEPAATATSATPLVPAEAALAALQPADALAPAKQTQDSRQAAVGTPLGAAGTAATPSTASDFDAVAIAGIGPASGPGAFATGAQAAASQRSGSLKAGAQTAAAAHASADQVASDRGASPYPPDDAVSREPDAAASAAVASILPPPTVSIGQHAAAAPSSAGDRAGAAPAATSPKTVRPTSSASADSGSQSTAADLAGTERGSLSVADSHPLSMPTVAANGMANVTSGVPGGTAVHASAEPQGGVLAPPGIAAPAAAGATGLGLGQGSLAAAQAAHAGVASQLAPAMIALGGGGAGTRQMTLRLEPAELGSVQIRLNRPQDGSTTVAVTADRPETLALLVRDQSQLQHALDQAGLPTDGRTLSFHLAETAGAAPRGMDLAFSGNGQPDQNAPGQGTGADPGSRDAAGGNGSSGRQPQSATPDLPATQVRGIRGAGGWQRAGLDITA